MQGTPPEESEPKEAAGARDRLTDRLQMRMRIKHIKGRSARTVRRYTAHGLYPEPGTAGHEQPNT
jgi:hypothetical protein